MSRRPSPGPPGDLEAVLDDCLARLGANELPDVPREDAAALRPLLELAQALDGLVKPPPPTDAFRARLAGALAAAPPPASLGSAGAPAAAPGGTTADAILALEACLEGRRASAAAALEPAVPAHLAEELAPLIELAEGLEALALPRPSADYRRRLAAAVAAAPAPRSLPRPSRLPLGLPLWRRLWRSTALTAAAAATVVLFLATGVTFASANALPGELLYPVKRTVEEARLWLASDEAAMGLHLAYADRRLQEAQVAPDSAGTLLADFTREVTAALVRADQALAAGAPRARVSAPLLTWLLGARLRLVTARPGLPPMAWRSALALVDAAIAALRSGGRLTVAPVPRLAEPDWVLARQTWRAVPWPAGGAAGLGPVAGLPIETGGPRAIARVGDARGRLTVKPAARSSVAPPAPAALGGSVDNLAGELRALGPLGPTPPILVAAASPPPVWAVEPPPSQAPEEQPKATRQPPVAVPSPTARPTDHPATATTVPTPEPTATPANYPPVVNRPPVCDPSTVVLYGSAICAVDVTDPEGEALTFEWTVAPVFGGMKDADQPVATYLAEFNMGGYPKVVATIHVRVTDSHGQSTEAETTVTVVPFLNGADEPRRRDGRR